MPKARQGHFLKEWRQYLGLTQGKFAQYVGMSSSNYNYLEGGKIGYTQASLEMIAEKLDVTPAVLLSTNPLLPEEDDHSLGWEMDRAFETLNPANQMLAIELITTLSKNQSRLDLARFSLTKKINAK